MSKPLLAFSLKSLATAAMAFVFIVIFFYTAGARDGVEIMKIKDVKVGMRGIGRTVVNGSKIEEFDVEILGVLKNNKLDDALQISGSSFLVQVSGGVIERSGGIAAGMSGSPVYINEKLVGAISSGWVMADHTIGLMTPVEEMLGLFRYMKEKKSCDVNYLIDRDAMIFIDKSIKIGDYKGVKIIDGGKKYACDPEFMYFEPAATPLLVSGLNGRNYDLLSKLVKKNGYSINMLNLQSNAGINSSSDFEIPDLKPGHAIAAQLVRGDINVTAIGTLTYLNESKFLAFAHSFVKKGDCNFFFAPANIYYCFSSQEMPFKIGAPGKPIGCVKVDRNEGIAGLIGELPRIASVRAKINDLDNNITKEFSSQIINDTSMMADLVQTILTQAIDEGINRQGSGFAKIKYRINGRAKNNQEFKIERTNYFYDVSDIATIAIDEILAVVNAVINNPFDKAEIYDIDTEFSISEQNPCAKISEISISSETCQAGESVEASLTIEPEHKTSFSETFCIPVPVNLPGGNYILNISCSDYLRESTAIDEPEFSEKNGNPLEMIMKKKAVSFKDLIRRLNSTEKNNQVVFEFSPAPKTEDLPQETKGAGGETADRKTDIRREPPSKEITKYKKGREENEPQDKKNDKPENKTAGPARTGRIKVTYPLSNLTGKIQQMISGLKSEYLSKNPEPAEENYKHYKGFEYIINPFGAQLNITVTNGEYMGEENENSDDKELKQPIKADETVKQ